MPLYLRLPLVICILFCLSAFAEADYFEIPLPTGHRSIVFEGKINSQTTQFATIRCFAPAASYTFKIPPNMLTITTADTRAQRYRQLLREAVGQKDPTAVVDAAVWAMQHGLENEYQAGLEAALKIDPQHPLSLQLQEFEQRFAQGLPESEEEAANLQSVASELIPARHLWLAAKQEWQSAMQVARSEHFIVLYDPGDLTGSAKQHLRAFISTRIKMLERTYRGFFVSFLVRGESLEMPAERLQALLVFDRDDFVQARAVSRSELSNETGFWDSQRNVSVFYADGFGERFDVIREQSDKLREQASKQSGANARAVINSAQVLTQLVEMERQRSLLAAISRNVSVQLAANSSLLATGILVPRWLQEGIAAYFEIPEAAPWRGMGGGNPDCLTRLDIFQQIPALSNLTAVVTDEIFQWNNTGQQSADEEPATSSPSTGLPWALTHFLMTKHTAQLVEYSRRIAKLPPHTRVNPTWLDELFTQSFGMDRKELENDWQAHLKSLKRDQQRDPLTARIPPAS